MATGKSNREIARLCSLHRTRLFGIGRIFFRRRTLQTGCRWLFR
ncbi:MAG: hypothetical protein CL726_03395 [Chloroflexi bacterium]|nr:hypothetical protein [Chloroflexota bacterium]